MSTPINKQSLLSQLEALTGGGFQLEVFDSLPSTNRYLTALATTKPLGDDGQSHICVASRQSAGVGRRGKQWHSGHSSITFSILSHLPLAPAKLGGLSLVTGLVVAERVEALVAANVAVKWPNDVLVESKKLAGILIEIPRSNDHHSKVVTGIGINYVAEDELQRVDQPFATLAELAAGQTRGFGASQASSSCPEQAKGVLHSTDRGVDTAMKSESSAKIAARETVIAEIAAAVMHAYQQFSRLGWQVFAERYAERNYLAGKMVNVHQGERVQVARVIDVDDSGGLLVDVDGVRQTLFSGEVSVRVQQ